MRSINSRLARGMMFACVVYMSAVMIKSPTICMEAATKALRICGEIVVPTLFPFIFCGNMFVALGAARLASRTLSKIMQPLFGVSGAGALALVLGIVSGYPVGAVCASELYKTGECSKYEAEKLLAFCNNSGPMFVIGAVGVGMLESHSLGVMLYIIHIFSALICGMIFKNYGKKIKTRELAPDRLGADIKKAATDIGAAVVKSVNTIMVICGFIIIFAVFTAALPDCQWRKYLYPILEITGGLGELLYAQRTALVLPITSFFIAFSGVSVLAQVYAITKASGLSILPYIVGKSLQGVIAMLLTYAAIKLSPCSEQTFSALHAHTSVSFDPSQLFAHTVILLGYCVLAVASFGAFIRCAEFMRGKARHRK